MEIVGAVVESKSGRYAVVRTETTNQIMQLLWALNRRLSKGKNGGFEFGAVVHQRVKYGDKIAIGLHKGKVIGWAAYADYERIKGKMSAPQSAVEKPIVSSEDDPVPSEEVSDEARFNLGRDPARVQKFYERYNMAPGNRSQPAHA